MHAQLPKPYSLSEDSLLVPGVLYWGAWGHSRHVGPSRECLAGAGHGVMANIGRPARVIFDIQAGPVARKGRSGVSPAYEPHSLEAGRLLSSLQSKP